MSIIILGREQVGPPVCSAAAGIACLVRFMNHESTEHALYELDGFIHLWDALCAWCKCGIFDLLAVLRWGVVPGGVTPCRCRIMLQFD